MQKDKVVEVKYIFEASNVNPDTGDAMNTGSEENKGTSPVAG